MKTLTDIVASGQLEAYLRDLGRATQLILPSIDGTPGRPCYFVMIVADDVPRNTHYLGNVSRESAIGLLRETAEALEKEGKKKDAPFKGVFDLPGGNKG